MIDLTLDTGKWVDIMERQPALTEISKLRVKILEGSMQRKEVESEVLAKPWHDEVRFMVGDWQFVTHWYEITEKK